MKNQNLQKILYLMLFIIASLSIVSCGKKRQAKKMSDSANNYIYAHTSGSIAKSESIRLRFTQDAADDSEIGQTAKRNIISFEPDIEGIAVWENKRTLLFTPKDHWTSGVNYIASINLRQLFKNVPSDAHTVEFDFSILELYYDIDFQGLQALNNNDLSKQELIGTLKTSDMVSNDAVEKVISATQNNRQLAIRWNHNDNNREHTFYIMDVIRADKDSELSVNWDGAAIGVDHKGKEIHSVPSLNNFKIMSAEVVKDKDQYIVLNFSDPLLKSQDLNGLIKIEGYNGKLKFSIDGNQLKVYPSSRLTANKKLTALTGIKNIQSLKMKNKSTWDLTFEAAKPQVRLVGKGVIMPSSNDLIFPFEAVSLNAIDVEIFKIYDNNILQFLQTNQLNGSSDLKRVGRIVLQKKINLKTLDADAKFYAWQRYALDLAEFFDADPNAIYQVRIGFRPAYSTYDCDQASNDNMTNTDENSYLNNVDRNGEIKSIWGGYYGITGHYQGYSWKHREDPCYPAYFNYNNFIRRNVIASDVGLIAKSGNDGSIQIILSDINTTVPIGGATLEFYDYQQQLIKTVNTSTEGIARTSLPRKAFAVIAKKGLQKGYLRLRDGNSLSLSRFDVAGAKAQKGLKGYLYGERGVWRPGDSLFLNFVLEDKSNKLPDNYPITFELYDSRGQLQEKNITSENINAVYPLKIKTNPDDPTGNWIAKIKAGGATFSKTLKIETVKPNRLKIDLDFGAGDLVLSNNQINGNLQVNWLHGAPAKNLDAKIEVQARDVKTTFDTYKGFTFDDPARKLGTNDPKTIFEEKVDATGKATVSSKLNLNETSAGKLKVNFKVRAFEEGGDFSVDNFSKIYSPYNYYAGLKIPENKYGEQRLEVEKNTTIALAAVDAQGNPAQRRELHVGVYRVNWRWWWDRSNDNVSRYNTSDHYDAIKKEKLYTNEKGKIDWNLRVDTWGRYLIRVCDEDGHCSGSYFYAGYPWYGDDDENSNREAASMLAFSTDKKQYKTGDVVELTIPTGEEGRALISIESGAKVIETYWLDATKGENKFSFYATPEMAPTVYANVSLIQPHAQVKNDLPIRLYGVIPIQVEDAKTKLKPTLKMPEVLAPKQKVTLEIAENNGREMAYTIAMVDDGLLDLTRFKTPDPWNKFYAREALGVKTWDVYDQVLGAYGGELGRILSVGGDGEIAENPENKKANRFKPVVQHLGPFFLESGATAKHTIELPNYVGSVRTMVVACNKGAYGNIEKTTPVRKPLMILATLPRVIGPAETLRLPVNVFAMEDKIKNVTLSVEESSGIVNIIGNNSQQLRFDRPDEQMAYFDLKVSEAVGIAKFTITAKGNGETATQEIEIDVRNPNPYITNVKRQLIDKGSNWTLDYEAAGMLGTNDAVLEISNLPPLNLGKHLKYLLRYPYGCLEQTTSTGFPLLYVDKLIDLTDKQKTEIPKIIQATINRLKDFQSNNNNLSYWQGGNYYNNWASIYAGHFLIEAKNLGYNVPPLLIERWIKAQKKLAKKWDPEQDNAGFYRHNSDVEQAYRLYALALAQHPEYGAMNRLRESNKLKNTARWRLAAAYAIAGKAEVAKNIVNNLETEVKDYSELSYTFGSSLRDRAMILETMTAINDRNAAAEMLQVMSDQMTSGRWWSTQSLAYSMMAIGKFVGKDGLGKDFKFSYQLGNGKLVNAGSNNPIMQIEIPVDGVSNRQLKVNNTSNNALFARLILTGQPVIGDQTNAANHLEIAVNYRNMKGNPIEPTSITQGTDFIAEVSISNPGKKGIHYKEMALTQVFPSGWEIVNSRMDNVSFAAVDQADNPTYRDIKDDRVHSFFNIRQNKTKTYRVQLSAAYQGRFYLPTTQCQAMYDNTINARQAGSWVEVVQ